MKVHEIISFGEGEYGDREEKDFHRMVDDRVRYAREKDEWSESLKLDRFFDPDRMVPVGEIGGSVDGAKQAVHSVTFKRQVVLEVLGEESSRAALARRYELSPNLIRTWEKAYHAGHLDDTARQDAKALEARIRELERMVGKLTMENEFLKKVEELSRRKENGKLLIISGGPLPSNGRAK